MWTTWSLYEIQHCISLDQRSYTWALQEKKEIMQLFLLLIKKRRSCHRFNRYLLSILYICIYICLLYLLQRPTEKTSSNKHAFPKYISSCIWDGIISSLLKNKSQALNLFNLMHVNCCSEYKISLVLHNKCRWQEDKCLGEKYHLSEIWSSQYFYIPLTKKW